MMLMTEGKLFSINFNTELYDTTYVSENKRSRDRERREYSYDPNIDPNPYRTTIAAALLLPREYIFSLRSTNSTSATFYASVTRGFTSDTFLRRNDLIGI